jgi:hypothetical protein
MIFGDNPRMVAALSISTLKQAQPAAVRGKNFRSRISCEAEPLWNIKKSLW